MYSRIKRRSCPRLKRGNGIEAAKELKAAMAKSNVRE
jgi:hypothetical protein